MPAPSILDNIAILIARISRRVVQIRDLVPLAGGSIQPAYVVTLADGARFFVKVGPPEQRERLRAEARGLEALRKAAATRVPQTWLVGGEGRHYFLMLEYLDLRPGDAAAQARLGRELAAQHRHGAALYGFDRDNYIGATLQSNRQEADWVRFFRDQRLLPQLQLAAANPASAPWVGAGEELAERLGGLFAGYQPQASLLHGDLWPGNAGFVEGGEPVLYDPAVYYGDREAELAMTELFGGFDPAFQAAYREAWPLDAGYATRKGLYKLYHLLNHFNLFGASYGDAVEQGIAGLLAELR